MLQLVLSVLMLSFIFLFIVIFFLLTSLMYSFSCSSTPLLTYLLLFSSFFCLQLPDCFVFCCCQAACLGLSGLLLVVVSTDVPDFLLPAFSTELARLVLHTLRGSFAQLFCVFCLTISTFIRGLRLLLLERVECLSCLLLEPPRLDAVPKETGLLKATGVE